jgi:hypothetical protein
MCNVAVCQWLSQQCVRSLGRAQVRNKATLAGREKVPKVLPGYPDFHGEIAIDYGLTDIVASRKTSPPTTASTFDLRRVEAFTSGNSKSAAAS